MDKEESLLGNVVIMKNKIKTGGYRFLLLKLFYRIPLHMEESYGKKKTVKGTYN